MDGLVVCALAGARRGREFDPRFVCPSRGPSVRSPPPPPSAARSTIGTAGGWVACLVLIVFMRYVLVLFVSGMSTWKNKKARHQAEHTCSSALRHWYRRPPEPHLLLIVLFGFLPRGFEPPSSGQQPAAQPLRYTAQKPALCLPELRNELSGLNSSHQRLGLRPPHNHQCLPAAYRPPGCPTWHPHPTALP